MKPFITNLTLCLIGTTIPLSIYGYRLCGPGGEGFIVASLAMVISFSAIMPTNS